MKFDKLISANYFGSPEKGSERVFERFLLFPKCIRGETRWIETARIRQIYTNGERYSDYGCSWHDIEFMKEKPSNE